LSRESCCGLMRRAFGIEDYEADGRPIASGAAPSLGVRASRSLVQLVTMGEHVALATVMSLIRRHVADRAVTVLAVVPSDEASDPALR
jgi:hypothetical protein